MFKHRFLEGIFHQVVKALKKSLEESQGNFAQMILTQITKQFHS